MRVTELRDAIIPALSQYCGSPIILADQIGPRPKVAHMTYKMTTPYGKSPGQAEETAVEINGEYKLKRVSDYKTTISFTSYAMDEVDSIDLAQKVHDWFSFDGLDTLQSIGVAVVMLTDVTNRDAFVINDYERRNGFDVILRVTHTQYKNIEWIEKVEINKEATHE